ncbi:hypothetical protein NL676_008544 [Syzygium grande]|nr:hypothetical protein NL676_008544 [Syzygium grande]
MAIWVFRARGIGGLRVRERVNAIVVDGELRDGQSDLQAVDQEVVSSAATPEEDFDAQPVIIEMDTKFEGEELMDWESDIESKPEPMEQELEQKDDFGAESMDAES